jgi:hypothetical protein
MPFDGQLAGKTGHEDILQNPDVEAFLQEHRDVPVPDEKTMEDVFSACPRASAFSGAVPEFIIAIDGSYYEASADAREPSRRVGYIKIGMVALDMNRYGKLDANSVYVDPIEVNRLLTSNALSMALPGANIKRKEFTSAAEGFRSYAQQYFDSERTVIGDPPPPQPRTTILDTLVALLKYIGDVVVKDGAEYVKVGGCPNPECPTNQADEDGKRPKDIIFEVPVAQKKINCHECGGLIFIVDAVRVGEAFVESGSNAETYGRLMLLSEHLLVAHWIRHYHETRMGALSQIGFVMDGPLSIAGESAKLYRAMMAMLADVNSDLRKHGRVPVFLMGLTKTGAAVDHFASLNWPTLDDKSPRSKVLSDFVFPITDEYRYTYITPRPRTNKRPFGSETYYGQDILIRTARGHEFVVCLPYSTASKSDSEFEKRFEAAQYQTAGAVIDLIRTLESDLYTNALVPVILAHEYASISLVPGGKVLDLATAQSMSGN